MFQCLEMHQLLLCRAAVRSKTTLLRSTSSVLAPISSCHVVQKRYIESQAPLTIFQSLADSSAVQYSQLLLENIHTVTGLPWWASLCLSTVLVRTAVTFPLSIYQNKIFARLEKIGEEMKALLPDMKRETAIAMKQFKWTEQHAKKTFMISMKKQYNLRVVRDNCHPFKSTVVIWAQLPMWMCFSMALRNMSSATMTSSVESQITFLELSVGGFLWIPNLALPDTSWIFPVCLGLVNLCIIELQVANRAAKGEQGKLQKYLTNFFRGFAVIMVPIAASVPSCMSFYWTMSSLCGLSHNLILMSPKFRRLVKIPHTPNELKNPYQNFVQHLSEKFKL